MSVDFFIDTNILAYTFDHRVESKQFRAKDLVREALLGKGCVSWQVIQEFCSIAQKKFPKPLSFDQLREYQRKVLFPICSVWPNESIFRDALTVKFETGYSWYDCLIVTAALRANCRYLYSEDLQDGRSYQTLQIINPFMHE